MARQKSGPFQAPTLSLAGEEMWEVVLKYFQRKKFQVERLEEFDIQFSQMADSDFFLHLTAGAHIFLKLSEKDSATIDKTLNEERSTISNSLLLVLSSLNLIKIELEQKGHACFLEMVPGVSDGSILLPSFPEIDKLIVTLDAAGKIAAAVRSEINAAREEFQVVRKKMEALQVKISRHTRQRNLGASAATSA